MADRIPGIDTSKLKYDVTSKARVSFDKSNEKKDAGQTYLPFFDARSIESAIPAPLSGLELIHYTTKSDNDGEYAGYIAPRISTIHYAPDL